ncbi:MAG TPA: biotin/lipoyl-containing protein [Gemmatimonadales bacterium]|nr:biotin/lipoyl-containing protein [Gemmatimonadales bacterium]
MTIRSRVFVVDVEGAHVTVDGERLDAHLAAVAGTPVYHLLLGGSSWTVAAQALEGLAPLRWALGAVGERLEVDVVDERSRQIQALTARGRAVPGGGVVKAPMPGLVVRVEVAAGHRVEAGAGLVVVEAMKMENELRAPRPGVVETVHVAAGQAVEKGAPLVTLGPVPNAEPSG